MEVKSFFNNEVLAPVLRRETHYDYVDFNQERLLLDSRVLHIMDRT